MLVTEDNEILYKELDGLCRLGVFESTQSNGQICYRKTSLQVRFDFLDLSFAFKCSQRSCVNVVE